MYELIIFHNGTPKEVIGGLSLEQIVPLESALIRNDVKHSVTEKAAQHSVQHTAVCTCPEPLMFDDDWACRECGNPPRR